MWANNFLCFYFFFLGTHWEIQMQEVTQKEYIVGNNPTMDPRGIRW